MLLGLALLTGAGKVQTRDGKSIEGDISFDDKTVVVHGSSDSRVAWDQVAKLTMQTKPGASLVTAAAGTPLPEGWKSQDIGKVKIPGTTACDAAGSFTIAASGWGAWGANDSFQFAYRPLEGDGQIIAHLSKLDNTNGPLVAGVMIRQSLDPSAPFAGACLYPNGEIRMPRRPAGGGGAFKTGDDAAPQAAWVRLARNGETLSTSRSPDGKFWQLVERRKIVMEPNVLVGLAVWTTGNAWSGTAIIDNVRVIPGTPGLSYFPDGDDLAQGIVLRDGNVIACEVAGLDDTAARYQCDGKGFTLPIASVARLIFSPVPPDYATPTDKHGILLASGDFIEGEVTGVSLQPVEWPRPPQLKASSRSVLFGPKNFETAREVIAVDIAQVAPSPAAYEVRMIDGSIKRAKSVTVTKEGVIVDDAKVADVAEVRKI